MRPIQHSWLSLLVLSTVLFALVGCANLLVRSGPTQTLEEVVELEGAERVNAQIRPFAGDIALQGGADALLAGNFTYNVADMEPEVDYSVAGGVGELEVSLRNERFNRLPVGNVVSEWDIRLNEEVPLALDLDLGLGDAEMDLRDLNLTGLAIDAGAGDVRVDAGRQTLDQLRFSAGVGDVDLVLSGGRIDEVGVEAGAGDVSLDLSGDWQSDLDVDLEGGLGNIDVTLPAGVGIRVEVDQGLGDVTAQGLTQENGNAYVNDLYGESDVTVDVAIEQGAGDINLRVAE